MIQVAYIVGLFNLKPGLTSYVAVANWGRGIKLEVSCVELSASFAPPNNTACQDSIFRYTDGLLHSSGNESVVSASPRINGPWQSCALELKIGSAVPLSDTHSYYLSFCRDSATLRVRQCLVPSEY